MNSTLFTDIVGFTKMSGGMSAEEVVTMLNKMISLFDERAQKEGIEKIKTIGDAYMAAVGLRENASEDDAVRMESTGKPMRIHVSETIWQQTKNTFDYKDIAEIEVKGKGIMKTYFL